MSTRLYSSLMMMVIAVCALSAADKSDKSGQGAMEIQVSRSKSGNTTPALHYRLPKNYFKFHFKLTTTTTRPGKYCDLATYFFDVEQPDTCDPKPVHSVTLANDVTVTELSEPDPAQEFDLLVSKGFFTESNLSLGFGEGNILTGLQSMVADHKVDFFVSLAKTAAGIIGSILKPLPVAAPDGKVPETAPIAASRKKDCEPELDETERVLLSKLGTSHLAYACQLAPHLRSSYLMLPDRYRTFVDGYAPDPSKLTSRFMNALALFIEYSEIIKDERQFFHPASLPGNADAFAGIVNARESKLKAIREQFVGSEKESTIDVPDIIWRFLGVDQAVELFTFDTSAKGGFCFRTAPNERWFPRSLDVPACKESDTLVSVYAVLLDRTPAAPIEVATGTNDATGIAYYVPGRATLRVYAKGKTEFDYFRQPFDIAQFGAIRRLPTRMANSTIYNVTLDPLTGGLKSIVVGNKPVLGSEAAAQIADFGSSISGIVDAAKAAKAAAKAASKEPTELEKTQVESLLKFEQLKIQLIESCKADATQSVCTMLLKQ